MSLTFNKKTVQDKLLVCGNVEGRFESLLARLEQICAKFSGADKFEQVFVCGEFFGPDLEENKKILSGEYIVPLPLYILGPAKADRVRYYTVTAGEFLGNNIIYLGRKGLYTTASGLKIAYFSGVEGEYQDECHFSSEGVKELIAQITSGPDFRGVDILLTTQWPAGLEKYTSCTPDVANDEQLQVSPLISRLAGNYTLYCMRLGFPGTALKPQYHFAALAECHYERPPYRNYKVLQESASLYHPTRFVGMARCGNPSRCKWLYAFNVTPCSVIKPTNNQSKAAAALVTECPFDDTLQELEKKEQRKRTAEEDFTFANDQYFYDRAPCDERVDQGGNKKRRGRNSGTKEGQPPKPCWFCLASPQVDKHLVVSIGEHTYLALAKGSLVEDHVLLMPIGHVQSLAGCQDPEVRQEMSRYMQTLKKFYAQSGRAPVFFERNWRTQHLQLQCVPMPLKKVEQVGDVFRQKFMEHSINYSIIDDPESTDIADIMPPGHPYFYVDLPDNQKMYSSEIDKNFPLNFGREVLAHSDLLNLEERVDWRHCILTKEEESDQAAKFRRNFQAYDFNNV